MVQARLDAEKAYHEPGLVKTERLAQSYDLVGLDFPALLRDV
jgi:hypothetical protein